MKTIPDKTRFHFRALIVLLGLLFIAITHLRADVAQNLFQSANEAYGKADYETAIKLYQDSITQGGASATVYYNLANAYYKQGNIGQSVLFYERALALRPGLAEARHNLQFVRHSSSLPPESDLDSPIERLASRLTLNEWGWLLGTTFWLSVFLVVFPKFSQKWGGVCRIFLTLSLAVLIVSIIGLTGAYPMTKRLVALSKETPLRVSPLADSTKAGYMAAGEMGSYSEMHMGYYLVTSQSGKQGWVAANDIGMVWAK
ncbi:MAG: tetratricopeptide repeat protein [Verrucomicrobiota bacterium]|nr:tetratricopeptide repeat protein [Verrucomicrobiota bacterium]